ncbi:hypothetical protein BJ742DRAFT_799159 [Cladochytrium replicatum]|nr:hypothetical protein BJ742DRAFT_799159 [Cladochytrium replicatum]
MVKSYLRYRSAATFGIITSSSSNAVYDHDGRLIVAPSLEDVRLWDQRKGVQVDMWKDSDNKAEVTCICRGPSKGVFAVGYSDGSIRLWNVSDASSTITFNGHQTAVTALAFDESGSRLLSGSKDTDLLVWDVVAEQGLYRLRGHKDQISAVSFLNHNGLNHVISISKDTLLKVWDLTTQHCVETLIAHRAELCAMAFDEDQSTLFTGSIDNEIRVWKIDPEVLSKKLDPVAVPEDMTVDGAQKPATTEVDSEKPDSAITHYGSFARVSNEKVVTMAYHPKGRYLGIQGADRAVEIFKLRTPEEIKKKLARKRRRQNEKEKKKGKVDAEAEDAGGDDQKATITDEIEAFRVVRSSARIRSFDFSPSPPNKNGSFTVMCALSNNEIEVFTVAGTVEQDEEPFKVAMSLDLGGHRTDVRTLALSSDDKFVASGSSNMMKVWNVVTGQCIRTLPCGYALCSTFVPGNNHVIVGTKTGEIELYDLASSSLLESHKGHEGPIWSLHLRPDKTGFVTGSADKEVKFWEFQLTGEEGDAKRRLTLVHVRTLRMTDDILCVRFSGDSKYLAVSLLDCTVKIFFTDTLKFYLSLYGHKLPVMSMDISSDSLLIATGSADKTLKIWGMDFGDCHRSLIAHDDSVMACQFVFGTHYIFTAGKDKLVKHWDGDKFEQIMKLEGHHGEVWALAVGKFGNIVVSASHDRSIRIWEKTEEPLFLEEEREKELEEMHEKAALNAGRQHELPVGALADGEEYQDDGRNEVGAPGLATMETVKAADRIFEALEIWQEDRAALDEHELAVKANPGVKIVLPPRSPYILAVDPNMTPEEYVLRIVERIRVTDLEEALLVLSFAHVQSVLRCAVVWSEKNLNPNIVSRIVLFLLRTHHVEIVATRSLRPVIEKLSKSLRSNAQQMKDTIGFNLAAMHFLRREWELEHSSEFFAETQTREEKEAEKKKRKRVIVS